MSVLESTKGISMMARIVVVSAMKETFSGWQSYSEARLILLMAVGTRHCNSITCVINVGSLNCQQTSHPILGNIPNFMMLVKVVNLMG